MDKIKKPTRCRSSCRKEVVARLVRGQILTRQIFTPVMLLLLPLLFTLVALLFGPNGPLRAEALYPYRILKNSSELITLTPEEWTSEYECHLTNTGAADTDASSVQRQASKAGKSTRGNTLSPPKVCYREPTAWRYHFIDELQQGPFKLLVQESSIDERLSDTIYTSTVMTGLNFNHYRFRSGQGRDVDLRNEHLVAGAQVNDQLCRDQLKQMLRQIEDMRQLLDGAKKDSTTPDKSTGLELQVASDASSSSSPAPPQPSKLDVNLDHRHFRLARVLDSYGRYESGHLGGRHHSFGIYEQCISTQLALAGAWHASNGNTSGTGSRGDEVASSLDRQHALANSRYCWASLSLDRYLSESLAKRKRHEEEQDNFGIHVGVCVPEACHSKSFNPSQPGNRELARDTRQLLQQIIDTQFRMPETIYLQQNLELDRVFCLVDADSKWAQMPLSGRILLAGLAGWACLLVFATYKRRHKHTLDGAGYGQGGDGDDCGATEAGADKSATTAAARQLGGPGSVLASAKARHSGRSLWENLDLFESWCEFIGARDKQRTGPINLDTLNPLKCLASLLVIMVHAGLIVGPLGTTPIQTLAKLEVSRIEMILMTGFVLVDTFFVISSLLLTYITLKKLLRQKIKRRAWRRQQQLQLRPSKDLMIGGGGGYESETSISDGQHEEDYGKEKDAKNETKNTTAKNGRGAGGGGQVESSQTHALAIDLRECELASAAVQQVGQPPLLPLPLACGPNTKSRAARTSPRHHLFGLDFFMTWAFITLYRYFRLVPLYFLVFWFKKSVFNYLGSGPLWDHGLNSDTPAGGCRYETWFTPISFMSAYLQANKQCLPQAWSVSNDLFFNLAAPPLIILFFKRPKVAKWLGPIMVVAGLIAGFYAYYLVDPRYRYELEHLRIIGAVIMFAVASHMYTNPVYRIAAVVIGTIGGYALYRYELRGTHELLSGDRYEGEKDAQWGQRHHRRRRHSPKQHEWPSWFKRVATPVALVTIASAVINSLMAVEFRQWLSEDQRSLLAPFVLVAFHAVWSLSNVVVLLRMVTDWKDSFLMRMASGKFWSVGSKLIYGLLLIHWDLLTYDQNTRHYAATFSRSLYMGAFSLAYLFALLISTVLYVCIENPLDKLTKTYLLRA